MNPLRAVLTAFLLVGSLHAADDPFAEARSRWLRGNYAEARALYERLAKDAKQAARAAVGISRCLESTGEYDQALAVVEAAVAKHAKDADLLARHAEVLYLRGQWEDAEKAADRAVGLVKDHFPARWVRAQIYRDRGDHKKADAEVRWFVRAYSERSNNDQDITDPETLLLVGLAGLENARWNRISDQFQFVLNTVFADALENDKEFWPAELHAGLLLLEKYNEAQATPAFDKALVINPQAAEAYVGKGLAALQRYEIKAAEQLAERALKINPNLVTALTLRADVHLASNDSTAALKDLEHARRINPRDERVLGRIAGCLLLTKKQAEFDKLAEEVVRFDPKPGLFYYELGATLEARRRYDAAERFYRKSAELRPTLPWANNSLGLLYMRLGREDEARVVLEKAFEGDRFNVRVNNSIKVLEHLESYQTIKTKHFELRFDPKRDPLLGKTMAQYLERIYEELAETFAYRPQGPILVEVFSEHEKFSGRVIGLPDLHTIGACTGKMLAMVSPRGKGIAKPFNWNRVLRHELVHVFNLDQTQFLVPHWLTEGLAVRNEGYPRPQEWNWMLLDKVPRRDLLNLETIDLGFIRPRSALERQLAYCQGQLYVEFIEKKYGRKAIGDLLHAYRDGLDTTAAIRQACKEDRATFEKGYLAYLDEVVKGLKGKPPPPPMSFSELQDAHRKNPDDLEIAGRLAETFLERRRKTDARKLAETILAKAPTHPVALYVKSRLLQDAGDEEEALKLLEAACDRKNPETKVLLALGRVYFEGKEFAKAAEIFELARQVEPLDARWLNELDRVYANTGERDKHVAVLRELARTDGDDIGVRRRLAEALLEMKQPVEAENYARQALEIDVVDAEARRLLGDALLEQGNHDTAIEEYLILVDLRSREKELTRALDARVRLASAYLAKGDTVRAGIEIEKVFARDPDHEGAKALQRKMRK